MKGIQALVPKAGGKGATLFSILSVSIILKQIITDLETTRVIVSAHQEPRHGLGSSVGGGVGHKAEVKVSARAGLSPEARGPFSSPFRLLAAFSSTQSQDS